MKTFYALIFATSMMAGVVVGQDSPSSMQNSFQPFQSPGEIIPGLPVSYLINAAGGIWQQERVIDSLAYACTNVLPYLGSVIPEVDQSSLYWGHICDQVRVAATDLDAFDATSLCNSLTSMLTDLIARNDTDDRVRRQADPSQEDPLDVFGVLMNITRDLYGIDVNDLSTICTNVKDNFLRPSLPDLISQFGTELMSALLPQATPICQNWDDFLQSIGINSTSPYYPIIQNAARIGSQAVGYDSRTSLCQAIEQASSIEARKTFSMNVITSMFTIPTNTQRCSMLANDAITDIINPILVLEEADGFQLTNDVIMQYSGFRDVDALCSTVEIAFTTEVRLPAPAPVNLINGTTLTIEFFMDAAGGIWQQDRLIDSLAFVCTDVLPDLESMVPGVSDVSQYYQPICQELQGAARDLTGFDATGFCNSITTMITDLISGESGARLRRQVDPSMDDPLDIIGILTNITRDLYGINVNNPETICPNVAQFLGSSLPDLLAQFGAEVMSALLPQAAPFCQDLNGFLQPFGIDSSSPFYQIIQDAARIGSQAVGYDSNQALCTALDQALSVQGDNGAARRTFARNMIESSFGIYADTARCSMIANAAINDIIEPIFRIENPGFPLTISDYTIYRYTGLMGVEGVCRAMETAFTKLSGSTVMVTVTVESQNGQPLVYSSDLANKNSSRFKELQTLFCAGIENHLTSQLGPSLRRVICKVLSYRSGSVVADMQVEVQATTQQVADSLAQGVVNLNANNNLTLSANGETLSASTLSVVELSGSIVNITVKGERRNGVALNYTSDLADKGSTLYMERQTLFCEGMKSYVTNQLGSTLLRVNCEVSSFRSGSVIADLGMELLALTQADADVLAQALRNLVATTNSLNLTAGTDTLFISSLALTAPEATTEGGLSTGALIGIIVGVVGFVIIFVMICMCCIMVQNMRRHQAEQMMMAEQGKGYAGKQNGAYSHDHVTHGKPRYVYGVNAASDRSRDRHVYESTRGMERRAPNAYSNNGPSYVSGSWVNEKKSIERNPHYYM